MKLFKKILMGLLPVMILGSAFAIILQPYVTNYTAVTIPADADLMLLETSNTGAKAKITAENLRSYMTANSGDYLLVANSGDYYTTNPLAYITGGQVLADNGLTKTVNTVEMGGTLTKSTNIYNDGNNFYVRGDGLNAISNAGIDNYLATHPTSIELYSNNWDMTVTDGVAEINDAFGSKGINYASDYSGNYDARTLIDKGYVDAEILSATPDTIYTADGTLLGSRTIDASGNILNFTNLGFLGFNGANNFEIEFDGAEFKFQSDRMQLNSPLAGNFDFNDLGAVWHDGQATPLGLQYYADYSGTMVDRSIVDKGYVDGEIVDASTLQTWQDTITNQIAQDGYIHVDLGATYIEDDGGATSSQIKIGGYEWEISDENSDTALVIKSPTNSTSEDGHMLMYDNRTSPEGIVYLNDYSATFTGNSLVNKHYVDNSIGAITGDFLPLAGNTEATRITGPVRLESEGSIQWSNYGVPGLPTMEINGYIGGNELLFQVYSGAYKGGFGIENFYPTLNYQGDDIPYAQKVDMHGYGLTENTDYSSFYTGLSLVNKDYVDGEIETASGFYVHLEGDEEINGIKTFSDNTVFNGNTFFNGTATYINSTNLDVEDKNIFLGVITGATDITANGGGTLLSGDNQHGRTFDNANDSFDIETDNLNVTNGAEYRINDVNILASTVANSTTLGATQNAISGFVYGLGYLTTETDPVWSAVSADYLLVADSGTYYNNTIASSLLPYLTIANSGNYYDTNFAIDSGTYYDANIASSLSPYLLLANSGDYYTTNPLNYITLAEVPADENIYNIDGTLTSDRTISAGGNSLTITGGLNTLIDSTYTRIKSSTDANTFVTVTTDDVSINSSDNITVGDTANEIIIGDIYDAGFDESYMEMDVLNKDRKVSLNGASDLLSMSNGAFSYAGGAGEMFFNSNGFAMYTPGLPATRNEIGYDTTTKIATVRGQSGVTLTTQGAEILMSPTLIQSSINDSYIAIADSPGAEGVYISSKEGPVFIGYYDSQTVPDTDEVNIGANTEINLKVASVGFGERLLVTSGVVAIGSDQVSVQARNNVGLLLDGGNLPIYMGYSMGGVPTPDTDEIYMSANTDITIETPIMELTGGVMRMTDNGSSRQFAINISGELDVQFLSGSTRETASTFTK